MKKNIEEKQKMKKILLRSLGLLIFLFLTSTPSAHAGQMSLTPGGGELNLDCANKVSIIIDTEGINTVAADAFIRFNPNEIEIIDQNPSVGGTQISTGHVYETYPGNRVDPGIIRLTGFNRSGFFNGRGILGTIKFKGKPGVQSSGFQFDFQPGSSVDSNIANVDSNDILSSANNAHFQFKPGPCPIAKPAPKVKEPEKVDETAFELEKCKEALVTLENFYKTERQEIGDFLCQTEELRKAAPSPNKQLLWFLLILLAISILLNLDLVLDHDKVKAIKIKFRIRRIKQEKRKPKKKKIIRRQTFIDTP